MIFGTELKTALSGFNYYRIRNLAKRILALGEIKNIPNHLNFH